MPIMPMRKWLPLAMLFAIVALAQPVRVNGYKSNFDVLGPNALLRVSARDPAASPSYSNWPANNRTRQAEAFRGQSRLLPASYLPIQFKNPKDLGIGKLLVANRGLGDPRFAGTVILLVRYDEHGVLGLVLNRRTNVPLSQVLDLKAAKDRSDPVYGGGPMEPSSVFALFRSSAKIEKADNVFAGVYLISDKDLFEKTISARPDPDDFHVFLGYAGWTQDQLRAEVQLGAWFVFPADSATVFDSDPGSLWQQMIQKTELRMAKTGSVVKISRLGAVF
jgi:putative transcriptional regulator